MITAIQKSTFLGPLTFQTDVAWHLRGRYNFLSVLRAYPGLRSFLASLTGWPPVLLWLATLASLAALRWPATLWWLAPLRWLTILGWLVTLVWVATLRWLPTLGWLPGFELSVLLALDLRFVFNNTLDLDHFIDEYHQSCHLVDSSNLRQEALDSIANIQTYAAQSMNEARDATPSFRPEVQSLIQAEPNDTSTGNAVNTAYISDDGARAMVTERGITEFILMMESYSNLASQIAEGSILRPYTPQRWTFGRLDSAPRR
jgi:hypothetical protein